MSTNEQLMKQCRREAKERYKAPHAKYPSWDEEYQVEDIILHEREAYAAALFHERSKPQAGLTVDELAQQIRIVDGGNTLGAGALAEALMPFLTAKLNSHGPTP